MIHFREPLQKEVKIDTVEYEASLLRQLGEHIDASQPPPLLLSSSFALSGTTYVCQILSSVLMSVRLNDSLLLH